MYMSTGVEGERNFMTCAISAPLMLALKDAVDKRLVPEA